MKKNRQRETTALRKGEFFKCERIFVHFARFCLLFREREREREKKKNEEDALHPSEKRSSRRSPLFSPS